MHHKFILILLFSLSISFNAYSSIRDNCIEPDKGFRNNAPGRGWFWGEKICEPVKDNETETSNIENRENQERWKILPKTADIPWEILDTLDPDEIANKIEPEAKKVAVMYPTEANIMAYRRLSNWILTKATTYTNRDTQVKVENPMLVPGALTAPTSEYKIRKVRYEREQNKQKILADYRERAKIIVYTRAGCSFCDAQRPLLEKFSQQYGWEIMERDINANIDESIRFDIEVTPDIFLLFNSLNGIQYQRIATGLTTLPDLVNAVINGLKYLGEDIDYETVYNN